MSSQEFPLKDPLKAELKELKAIEFVKMEHEDIDDDQFEHEEFEGLNIAEGTEQNESLEEATATLGRGRKQDKPNRSSSRQA